jgi:hypothetical protein
MEERTELKASLQEIAALIGLLRSDMTELAQMTPGGTRRGQLVDHIHWIADRLDKTAKGLDGGSASHAAHAPSDIAPSSAPQPHARDEKPDAAHHKDPRPQDGAGWSRPWQERENVAEANAAEKPQKPAETHSPHDKSSDHPHAKPHGGGG